MIGLRHDRWGEDVCAAAIFKSGIDESEAARDILSRGQSGKIPGLSTYEAPSRVIPITSEARPLTSTGKVQRSALQDIIQDQIDNS